jgi:hypothetical protein
MATYEDKMQDLSALTDEDLASLETEITSAFEAADQADDLDAMSAAADALDAVRAQKAERGESAVEEPVEAAAPEPVAADGKPEFLKDDEDEDKGDEPEPDDAEAKAEGDEDEDKKKNPFAASGEQQDDEPAAADVEGSDAVTASGDKAKEAQVDIPEDRMPVETAAPAVTITAGADVPGVSFGAEFRSSNEVADAMLKRIDSLRNVRSGDGEQIIVATVASAAPTERQLFPGDEANNREKIERVVSLDPNVKGGIVASGGYCAPLEVRYDIFGLGVADRPIRDALAGFQATRGGIRYTQPPVLSDLANAVGVWTAANDANPTAPTTKPCLKVACSPELTATLDAVTMCLAIGNLQARAYPELVSRNNELAMIQHARLADMTLLNKISALSTAVTSAYKIGFARDFLEAVGRGAAAYRARHRMGTAAPLRVFAPAWVKDAIREDLTWGLPGDQLEWADSVINGFFSTRNVNITWHLDDASSLTTAQATGALKGWPASFKWQIFAEGTFLFLDGGTLDLGIVRDGDLVATNDYKMFVETFEGLAKIGIESVEVTTTTKVTGQVAATVDTTTATDTTL